MQSVRSALKAAVAACALALTAGLVPPGAAACEGTIVRPCTCPARCDSDSCERVCTGVIRTGGGCLYYCGGCSVIGGAVPASRAAVIAGLIATSARAADAAAEEKSFTNEDGDFLLVPSKPGQPDTEDSAGIGVQIINVSSAIIIQSVMAGGVAARGGLKDGDEVLSIDGRRCQGMPLSAAAKSLRGRSGTLVVLRIRSKQTGKIKSYPFNRAPFPAVQSASEKGVMAKTIPAKEFNGACPKQHEGCRFLAKDNGECIYTCKTDPKK